jgi:hypothetical protein
MNFFYMRKSQLSMYALAEHHRGELGRSLPPPPNENFFLHYPLITAGRNATCPFSF